MGNCGMAMTPTSTMNRAITQANTGRLIKNCGMTISPNSARDGAELFAGDSGLPRARGELGVRAQPLDALDHHLLPGTEPGHHAVTALDQLTDLNGHRLHLALGIDHPYAGLACAAGHGLLRHAEGGGVMRAGNPCLHVDRKSTRLNSSHSQISYAVFCLKKK